MISKKTINAVELCVLLASQRGGDYLTTAELAPRLALSISYLENILKPLKDSDIVLSMKGPGGGYALRGTRRASLFGRWPPCSRKRWWAHKRRAQAWRMTRMRWNSSRS